MPDKKRLEQHLIVIGAKIPWLKAEGSTIDQILLTHLVEDAAEAHLLADARSVPVGCEYNVRTSFALVDL